MKRGAVFWLELEGRRPVCVLTRDEAIGSLAGIAAPSRVVESVLP